MPSDPAQVIVNHASFRVQLGASSRRTLSPRIVWHPSGAQYAAHTSGTGTAGRSGTVTRRPVIWSGRSAPDDTGAHRLLQAVRSGSVRHADETSAGTAVTTATQLVPRTGTTPGYGGGSTDPDETVELPVVGAPRRPAPGETRLLPSLRTADSTYGTYDTHEEYREYAEPAYGRAGHGGTGYDDAEYDGAGHSDPGYGRQPYEDDDVADDQDGGHEAYEARDETAGRTRRSGRRHADDPARHAYYPGRRMNLGVVLLPLRLLLGGIAVYAGMSKLCDPLYFDSGKRGSMVKWLTGLHPWEAAEPLHRFALHHPVGSGLAVAFLQVVIGVLTILGCWQRVAAAIGALLSATLIAAAGWRTVPAYDASDFIHLAAWSSLIVAGAPVYSVDGRLAALAWRRLGPRSGIWDLRRFVLRRGALITVLVIGLSLLVGSLLGGAVRDVDHVVVPGPGEAPRNEQPGSPLPRTPGGRQQTPPSVPVPPSRQDSSASPSDAPSTTPGETRGSSSATSGTPSETQGTGRTPPRPSAPARQEPSTGSGPASGGTSTGGSGGSGDTPGGTDGDDGSSSDQSGLVGGLLG
ncbi:DoxX family membrane protein [Streptomyces thermoalcalitolerans]|uniref:DoxX family membrane protein n=1 Tax=Streptomyces thermoalcalitolerans TaxID=65605 RepID=A0ABN1P3J7_9ACTN